MKSFLTTLMFLAVITGIVSLARGFNYLWLTNQEQTRFGDYIAFRTGDTLDGPVRSNSTLAISGHPVFLDRFIESGSMADTTYDRSMFLGPPPVFGAIHYWPFDSLLQNLRDLARMQNNYYRHYFRSTVTQYELVLGNQGGQLYSWPRGTLKPNNLPYSTIDFGFPPCLFFEGPVRIRGVMSGNITIASSNFIEIDDNILYVDSDPLTGITPQNSANLLGLVSGGDIKIRNTSANGRNNSGGRGLQQTNQDSTDVVITGMLFALGESLTFEQQNDPDSGFVYNNGFGPDDRGTVHLFGGVVQKRRGYFHRSTLGSTGYLKKLHYDHRLDTRYPAGICSWSGVPYYANDSLNFGGIFMGQTARDTAFISCCFETSISFINTTPPFSAEQPIEISNRHAIPVSFTPPQVGSYAGVLVVGTPEHYFQIYLSGRGIRPPQPLTVKAAPNPFNATTTIHFNLPEAGAAQIRLYDVLGRTALNLDQSAKEAGEHSLVIDGSKLATGVYFLSVRAGQAHVTQKLLLLK
jgi:hypothetical protein